MRKFLYFISISLIAFLTSTNLSFGQGYNEKSSLQCISSTRNLSFSLPQPKVPSGDGVLTFYYQGDMDGGTAGNEAMDLYDANNNLIGTSNCTGGCTTSDGQCESYLDSIKFNIPLSTLNQWASNPTIDFDVVAQSGVSLTLCTTPGSCAQIKLEYPSISGPDDAGVVSLDNPVLECPGNHDVIVTVRNTGTNRITSLDVNWELNGVAQSTFSYSGLIDTLNGTSPNTVQITLGNVNFTPGVYNLKIWTSDPNGNTDVFNNNDTIRRVFSPSILGNYTLDASLPTSSTNFNSFSDLANTLNSFGICGPLHVDVAPGVYDDVLRLDNVPGVSSVNTITIDGADSALVTLENDLSTGSTVIDLMGTPYTTIKNMTIKSLFTAASDHFGVHLGGSTHHDSLLNLHVLMDPTNTGTANGIGASASPADDFAEGDNANYTTVMNCYVEGGSYAYHFEGGTTGNWNVGNTFINNTATNMDDYGFYFDEQDTLTVVGNTATGNRSTAGDGIYGFDCMNFICNENLVVAQDYGIYWADANSDRTPDIRAQVINNMVTSTGDYGIFINDGLNIDIFHNSVYVEGTTEAFYVTGTLSDNLDVRNNIFSSLTSAAMETLEPDTVFSKLDYNVYYTTGTNLLLIDGTTYSDLATYQTAQPLLNTSSIFADPQFTSTSDLHIVGAVPNDAGDNSVGVGVDIDGDVRPFSGSTIVDIGADEYSPPLCPPPFNGIVDSISSDTAVAYWTSNGGSANTVQYQVVTGGSAQGTNVVASGSSTVDSAVVRGLNASSPYDVFIREICGRGDTSTWLGPISFFTDLARPKGVNCNTGLPSVIFTEEFDAVGGWTGDISQGGTNGDFNFPHSGGTTSSSTGPTSAHSGSNYVYTEGSGSAGNPWGTHSYMVSPAIDLTSASDSAELSFWMHAFGQTMGTMTIGVGNSPSGPFTPVFSYGGELQTVQSDPWEQVGVRLDNYVGQVIYLEFDFLFGSDFYSDFAIDLLEVTTCISCPNPTSLQSTVISSDSVDLDWTDNASASQWEIEYGPTGFQLGNGTTTIVNSKPFGLGSLSAATEYDFYVRSICGPGDTSASSLVSTFETFCSSFTAPYYSGFESDDLDLPPNCWAAYETYANGFVEVEDFTGAAAPFAGSQALYIFSSTGFTQGADTLAAFSPQFTDLPVGDKRIRFQGNSDDPTTQLIVGTVPALIPSATFTPVDTITFFTADVYQEVIVNFNAMNGYNGTDEYIVLAHDLNNTSDYIRIDEFNYEVIPSCPKPTNLTASNVTASGADLSWQENGTATSWHVEFDTSGFTQGTGRNLSVVNSNPTAITGLVPNETYEYYVRAICAPGDSSVWEGPFFFATPCVTFNVPYFEPWAANFSNCWSRTDPNDVFTTTACAGSTGESLQIYGVNGSTAESPIVDVSSVTTVMVSYEYRAGTAANCGETADAADNIDVDYWDGSTWNNMRNYAGGGSSPTVFTPDTFVVPASAIAGGLFKIRFFYVSGSGANFDNFNFDNVEIQAGPTCIAPTNLASSNVTANSADIAFNTASSQWQIEFGPVNFALGTGTRQVINTNPYTITSLAPSTTYEVYVRDICAPNDTSSWAGPLSFTTACVSLTATYSENFDAAAAIPACWNTITPAAATIQFGAAIDHGAAIPSPPNAVEINNSAGNDVMLVTPGFSDLSSGLNRVRVKIAAEGGGSGFEDSLLIGVMTDPNDANTFTPLDTIDNNVPTAFVEYTFDMDNTTAIGSAEYIAFSHLQGGGGYEFYIDDFVYEPIPPNDLGVVDFIRPEDGCGLGMDTVEVVIQNFGSAAQSNFPIGYSLNGVAITPETFTGTIAPFGSATFKFMTSVNLTTSGSYDIDAYTLLATDGDVTNDSSSTEVNSISGVSLFPYTESFESGAGGWFVTGQNTSWELGAPLGAIIDTASDGTQAWVTNLVGDHGNAELGYVNSPCFDLTNIDDPFLEMDIWYDIESYWDGAILEASSDGGATWSIVGQLGDTVNWYNDTAAVIVNLGLDPTGQAWTGDGTDGGGPNPILPGSNGWITAKHYLYGYENQANVRLRMVFASDGATVAEGMGLDNVRITDNAPVGIEDAEADNVAFDVYPNPSNGLFTLTMKTLKEEKLSLSVRDVKGKLVYENNVSVNGAYREDIDFSDLAKGVYYLQVQSDEVSKVEKLIIQ